MTRTQQRTLAFCNRVRVALGKKPRKTLAKGIVGDWSNCPIATTIGKSGINARSTTLAVNFNHDRLRLCVAGFNVTSQGSVDLPDYAQQFIRTFDHGRYPELIA